MKRARETLSLELGRRLDAAANERTREWWERYLKGAVPFRGVPMGEIRAAVHAVWAEEGLEELSTDAQIDLALDLFAEPFAEDKLAGVLALAERLLSDLTLADLPRLARPFEDGQIDDWSTCDWYCVKVLGPFVEAAQDRREAAEAVAAWRFAAPLWQRRAASVAFVNVAPQGESFFPGFTALLLDVCATNVGDGARFSQTSVGWLLRELSRADPNAVTRFVRTHASEMSSEARRSATARLRRRAHDERPRARGARGAER